MYGKSNAIRQYKYGIQKRLKCDCSHFSLLFCEGSFRERSEQSAATCAEKQADVVTILRSKICMSEAVTRSVMRCTPARSAEKRHTSFPRGGLRWARFAHTIVNVGTSEMWGRMFFLKKEPKTLRGGISISPLLGITPLKRPEGALPPRGHPRAGDREGRPYDAATRLHLIRRLRRHLPLK